MSKLFKLKTKFWAVYTVIGLAQPLALLFPVAWPLRFLKKFNPLWFVLDDTRLDNTRPSGYASDYEIWLDNYKFKPWGVFTWHVLRNRVWNFTELVGSVPRLEGSRQDIEITQMITDELYDGYGNKQIQDGPYPVTARLKYVGKKGQDPYQVNTGTIISKKYSTIGEGEIVYQQGSFEGWRYSSAKIVKPWWAFGKEKWRIIFLGTNSNRYALQYKHKAVTQWGDWED